MRDTSDARRPETGARPRVRYLVRIRGSYAFRRRYPRDVRSFVESDAYFKRLEAGDFQQAAREVQRAMHEFDAYVARVRAEHGLLGAYRLRAEDAAALAARVPAMVLANDEADRRPGIGREQLQRYRNCVARHARAATEAALSNDTRVVEPLAQLLLAQEGIRAAPVGGAHDELLRQLLLAQQRALTLLSQRLCGHPIPTPPLPDAPGGQPTMTCSSARSNTG